MQKSKRQFPEMCAGCHAGTRAAAARQATSWQPAPTCTGMRHQGCTPCHPYTQSHNPTSTNPTCTPAKKAHSPQSTLSLPRPHCHARGQPCPPAHVPSYLLQCLQQVQHHLALLVRRHVLDHLDDEVGGGADAAHLQQQKGEAEG